MLDLFVIESNGQLFHAIGGSGDQFDSQERTAIFYSRKNAEKKIRYSLRAAKIKFSQAINNTYKKIRAEEIEQWKNAKVLQLNIVGFKEPDNES